MVALVAPTEITVVRRVFEAWSVEVPACFAETFVDADSYWHAYDECRSVSLSSIVLTEKGRPVSARRIVRRVGPPDAPLVDELPPGLVGWAAWIATVQPAIASQALSGVLASEGRALIVTITGDDADWARRVWLSIRSHTAPLLSRRERRSHHAGRRKDGTGRGAR